MSATTSKVGEVRVPEPLAQFAPGFWAALLRAGYSPLTVVVHLRLMGHLSRWLAAREPSGAELTAERIEAYLGSRRAEGYRRPRTRCGLDPLVAYLAGQCGAPAQEPAPESAMQALVKAFEGYLRQERGLAALTVSTYAA